MTEEEQKVADAATAKNDAEKKETFSVSKEDWEKSQATLTRLLAEKRVATKAAETKIPDDAEEAKTQKQKIEEMQASMRKDRERLEMKAKRNGIREAIAENGITDPDAIEILFDHVEKKHGPKIKVGDDDQASYEDDVTGDVKPVSALIGDILKSPKGQFFKPKAPGPSTRAGRGNSAAIPGQKSYMEMSQDELLKLTPAQRAAAAKSAMQGS